jgi:hypothetical protein
MESGTPGRLKDYGEGKSGGWGTGKPGKPEEPNRCLKAVNARLEEVANCPYYLDTKNIPSVGMDVILQDTLVNGRLAIVGDGKVIGYLPTNLNYLMNCMSQGHRYSGDVASSSISPFIRVTVDIAPTVP